MVLFSDSIVTDMVIIVTLQLFCGVIVTDWAFFVTMVSSPEVVVIEMQVSVTESNLRWSIVIKIT